ncbi:FAD-binding FR-type domain-containing protein, partial [Favolaschia claudopus]
MPTLVFHLHGKSALAHGVSIDVQPDLTLHDLQKTVADKLGIALPSSVSFHASADEDTTTRDLRLLETVQAIVQEGRVAVLVSGKKVHPVPGPTGGLPFIGGYSEIYPDFIGNYHRLFRKYGHVVHVWYLGKSIYLTDDPDCAGVVLKESEYFTKKIDDNSPLAPFKLSGFGKGIFTSDSDDWEWAEGHKFMMTAMGAKAMRGYVRIMDHSARRLIKCFDEMHAKGKSFDAFSWGLRGAAQTIGEVLIGVDLKMLENAESPIADVFHLLARNLTLAQTLVRRGRIYRALPNPEDRAKRATEREIDSWIEVQKANVIETGCSQDMPLQEAAVKTSSVLDYMLHATDEDGKKMNLNLVNSNILTFLGAGQVTSSSVLSWLWFCLATFPAKARKLHASLVAAGLGPDEEITAEQLGKLEYLDWFVKEGQRLYNPAFQPTRQARKDVILPGGLFIPKDAQVTVSLHALMVNSEHWKDPLVFNPERWGTEEVKKRHKYAYLPFATGARGCIGFNFALQEIKVILTRVVLNFQIENTTEGAVIYDPNFIVFKPLNFSMKLHKQIPISEVKLDDLMDNHVEEKLTAPQPTVGTGSLPKFWAVHASNTGSCEGMAGDAAAKARQLGFSDVQVVSLADSPLADRERTAVVAAEPNFFLICVATYNGEPPDSALGFAEELDAEIKDLKAGEGTRFAGINFCVFGAGNTEWGATYQLFPNKVDSAMAALGGNRIFSKGSGDANADQDGDFTEWSTKLWAATAASIGLDVSKSSGSTEQNLLASTTSYTAQSVKVIFQPPTSPVSPAAPPSQPPVAEFAQAIVKSNLELVDEDSPMPRSMRLIELEIPEGLVYREGDHLEVFPENDPAIVERLLASLDFVADAVFKVVEVDASVNPRSLAATLLDRQVTLRELLTYHADLSGPLQRSVLLMISSFVPEDDEFADLRQTLRRAGEVVDSAEETFFKQNRNFAQLIINHPILAQAFDLPKLLVILRNNQPRRYSIASSPLVDPRVAKLCVGVEDSRVGDFEGLCSGFLKRAEVGHGVWVRHCSSGEFFHLPDDPTIPVTMVGAGTGIAPFLGFMASHRRAQGIKTQEAGGVAPFRLLYGTSHHDMDALKSLVHAYIDDGTLILDAVYSADHSARRFAQQLVIRYGVKIWDDLNNNNGRVFVCGSAARVGAGVRNSLAKIGEQVGGLSDAQGWVAGLKKAGRYTEDIFG